MPLHFKEAFLNNPYINFLALSEPHTPYFKQHEKQVSGITKEHTLRIGLLDPKRDFTTVSTILVETLRRSGQRSFELENGFRPISGNGIKGARVTIEWNGVPDNPAFIQALIERLEEKALITSSDKENALAELAPLQKKGAAHPPLSNHIFNAPTRIFPAHR